MLAAGITVSVVAWGFLVYSAIDFGISARSGDDRAWWFLALASLGAVACLFLAFMLLARLARTLGLTSAETPAPHRHAASTPAATPAAGGPAAGPPLSEPTVAVTPGPEVETTAERPAVRPVGHRAKR